MENITISNEILEEFKEYTKISHDTEDEHLKRVLAMSYNNLISRFGEFDLSSDLNGKSLVFARARYDYEDLLEFLTTIIKMILNFGFINRIERDSNEE